MLDGSPNVIKNLDSIQKDTGFRIWNGSRTAYDVEIRSKDLSFFDNDLIFEQFKC